MGAYFSPKSIKKMDEKTAKYRSFSDAKRFEDNGIYFTPEFAAQAAAVLHRDEVSLNMSPVGQTPASMGVPIERLRAYDPEFIRVMTTPVTIDYICGIKVIGSFEDEETAQPVLEMSGRAVLYGDHVQAPRPTSNVNWVRRQIVRLLTGMEVGLLEQKKAARINQQLEAELRAAAGWSLELERNRIGFYGYNDGQGLTYGLLNDPNLLPYETIPANAAGKTKWQDKGFEDIISDVNLMVSNLVMQCGGVLQTKNLPPMRLVIPLGVLPALNKATPYTGLTARKALQETYPMMDIIETPEFNQANGTDSVVYLIADEVANGGGSMRTLDQLVPAKSIGLGVEQKGRLYREEYGSALAGIIVRKPMGITRMTGI